VGQAACGAPSPQPPRTNPNEQRGKEAITSVREAHSECDWTKRHYQALIAKSGECDVTKGGEFEADMKQCILDEALLDSKLVAIKTECINQKVLTDDDALVAASACEEILALMKAAAKKGQALKSCFVGDGKQRLRQ
ncbi:unnamed protein product, partial [Prorocentrum cordatum]